MRYRKLTSDGDFSFGNGQKDIYKDVPEAVAQAVETRLLLWLGEWYLDITDGTPYMIDIFGKHSKEKADSAIQKRVKDTQGVVSIENYVSTVDADTRMMNVTFDLNTLYGPTKVQVANYVNY